MKELAISLIFLAWAAPSLAVELASPRLAVVEGKLRAKDWQRLATDPAQSRRYVEVTRDLAFSCPAEGGEVSPRTVTVLRGIYPIERRLHSKKDGVDWLLVPAVIGRPVLFGYNNSAGRTWGYEHAIAVNPETLAVFPREIVSYTQEWSRLDRSRWNEVTWDFGCAQRFLKTGEGTALAFATEAQFQAARSGNEEQDARKMREDSTQRKQLLDRERPMKSQIGAQLCKESGPLIVQGFTENRSPDNGKIQIRIWRASLSDRGRPSSVVPNDFRESVVWDDPDGWHLCDN